MISLYMFGRLTIQTHSTLLFTCTQPEDQISVTLAIVDHRFTRPIWPIETRAALDRRT
jgi:hypothetical protein